MTPVSSETCESSDVSALFQAAGDLRLPGYQPSRSLGAGRCGPRVLATRQRDGEQVVLHAVRRSLRRGVGRISGGRGSRDARRFMELVAPLRCLESSHIVPVDDVVADASSFHWLVTPYLGSADGLLTLERLRRLKDNGQLSEHETERAVEHLLAASETAHARGLAHGPIQPGEVLINRHGSLSIELYGLARRLNAGRSDSAGPPTVAELRSIAELAYTLLTGTLEAPEPYIPASRLVKRLSPRWDAWLAHALDRSRGFDSAAEARFYLPSGEGELAPAGEGADDAQRNSPRPAVRKVSLAAAVGAWRSRSTAER